MRKTYTKIKILLYDLAKCLHIKLKLILKNIKMLGRKYFHKQDSLNDQTVDVLVVFLV